MSTEEIERKVDGDAEGEPGNARRRDTGMPEDPGSAVGGLLTELSWGFIPPLSLSVLLFGGLVLAFSGAALWVEETVGIYPAMVVVGAWAIVLAYLLALIYARRGWI